MKRLGLVFLLLGACCLLSAPGAHAISLNFLPASPMAPAGTNLLVDVVVSGLGASTPAGIVSAFDLDVTYDPTILSATNVSFGSSLGDPFAFPFFEAFTNFDLTTAGVVDLAELSLLSDTELDALQGDSVTLATIGFDAIGVGTSDLAFVLDAVNDVKGRNAMVLDLVAGTGSVAVAAATVPEPSSLLLLGSALIGLAGWQCGRQRVQQRKT